MTTIISFREFFSAHKWKIMLAVLLFLALIAGVTAYDATLAPSVETGDQNGKRAVYVPTGANESNLDSLLRPYVKHDMFLWEIIDYCSEKYGGVKSGKFTITDGMSNYDLMKRLFTLHGEEVRVRFNATSDIESIAGTVARQIEADSISLMQTFTDSLFLDSMQLDRNTLRAFFIPNTYNFYWDTSAGEFLSRMVAEYRAFWTPERLEKASSIGMTPVEVSTLASIVQAETAKTDERADVAGLYVNRLKRGIRLQSDPTVIYAMRHEKGVEGPIRRVYLSDLKIKSPYNTYINKGLPPSPINIPDISAIDAVLNHTPHNYIYMCASVERFGYHEFAEKLSEHNKNRRKYVKWVNDNGIKR